MDDVSRRKQEDREIKTKHKNWFILVRLATWNKEKDQTYLCAVTTPLLSNKTVHTSFAIMLGSWEKTQID